MSRATRTLEVAGQVAKALRSEGAPCAVIGAMALAFHGYVRHTEDFDLGTDTDPFSTLFRVERALQAQGFRTELRTPDADDPLGGVLVVTGDDFDDIEVVNYYNPMSPRAGLVGGEAVRKGTTGDPELPVVDIPHLVALKLYAGGRKSQNDVMELLARVGDSHFAACRAVCERFGLAEAFDGLIAELGPTAR